MTSARKPLLPWLVWGVAVLLYVVAIINRSSLAALGPAAQEHFGIDATTLSIFAVIQLVVYAAMQIPVGVLLDRVGPSVMLLSGGVIMMLGQVVMATVQDVALAILARVLVGAGDACTFISVMRMLPEWFGLRQLPVIGQLTALIGQAGQLISVTPLAVMVGAYGWAAGFIGVAAVGLLMLIFGVLVLRDKPGSGTVVERVTGRLGRVSREARSLGAADSTAMIAAVAPPETGLMQQIELKAGRMPGRGFLHKGRRLLSIPGVRLAFWVHFTPPFAATTFVLLWGTPFLTGGMGMDRAESGALLSLTVISGMVSSLLLGPLSSRFVERRVWIAVTIAILVLCTWSAVLLWPGKPPVWLLAVLMVVISIGGPGSMIAFEVSRSHAPASFAGFATGLVNTGGFIAALLAILCIGLALDVQGAGSPADYSLGAFRWAFAVQLPILAVGVVMMLVEMRRTNRWMQANGRTLR